MEQGLSGAFACGDGSSEHAVSFRQAASAGCGGFRSRATGPSAPSLRRGLQIRAARECSFGVRVTLVCVQFPKGFPKTIGPGIEVGIARNNRASELPVLCILNQLSTHRIVEDVCAVHRKGIPTPFFIAQHMIISLVLKCERGECERMPFLAVDRFRPQVPSRRCACDRASRNTSDRTTVHAHLWAASVRETNNETPRSAIPFCAL